MRHHYSFMVLCLLILSLASCSGSKEARAWDAAQATADAQIPSAAQAVEVMYQHYIAPTEQDLATSAESQSTVMDHTYMCGYMGRELLDIISMACSKQEMTGELCLGYDYWINAQDADGLQLIGTEVIAQEGEQEATVRVRFMNLGEEHQAQVVVRYNAEVGQWQVCDFLDPNDHSSLKAMVQSYLDAPYPQ